MKKGGVVDYQPSLTDPIEEPGSYVGKDSIAKPTSPMKKDKSSVENMDRLKCTESMAKPAPLMQIHTKSIDNLDSGNETSSQVKPATSLSMKKDESSMKKMDRLISTESVAEPAPLMHKQTKSIEKLDSGNTTSSQVKPATSLSMEKDDSSIKNMDRSISTESMTESPPTMQIQTKSIDNLDSGKSAIPIEENFQSIGKTKKAMPKSDNSIQPEVKPIENMVSRQKTNEIPTKTILSKPLSDSPAPIDITGPTILESKCSKKGFLYNVFKTPYAHSKKLGAPLRSYNILTRTEELKNEMKSQSKLRRKRKESEIVKIVREKIDAERSSLPQDTIVVELEYKPMRNFPGSTSFSVKELTINRVPLLNEFFVELFQTFLEELDIKLFLCSFGPFLNDVVKGKLLIPLLDPDHAMNTVAGVDPKRCQLMRLIFEDLVEIFHAKTNVLLQSDHFKLFVTNATFNLIIDKFLENLNLYGTEDAHLKSDRCMKELFEKMDKEAVTVSQEQLSKVSTKGLALDKEKLADDPLNQPDSNKTTKKVLECQVLKEHLRVEDIEKPTGCVETLDKMDESPTNTKNENVESVEEHLRVEDVETHDKTDASPTYSKNKNVDCFFMDSKNNSSKTDRGAFRTNFSGKWDNQELKRILQLALNGKLDGHVYKIPLPQEVEPKGGDVFVFLVAKENLEEVKQSDRIFWRKHQKKNKNQPIIRTYYYLSCPENKSTYSHDFKKTTYELKENTGNMAPIMIEYSGNEKLISRRKPKTISESHTITIKKGTTINKKSLAEHQNDVNKISTVCITEPENSPKGDKNENHISSYSFANLIGLKLGPMKDCINKIVYYKGDLMVIFGFPECLVKAKTLMSNNTETLLALNQICHLENFVISGISMRNTDLSDQPKFPVSYLLHQKICVDTIKHYAANFVLPLLDPKKKLTNVTILHDIKGLSESLTIESKVKTKYMEGNEKELHSFHFSHKFQTDLQNSEKSLEAEGIILCCVLFQVSLIMNFNEAQEKLGKANPSSNLTKNQRFPRDNFVEFVISGGKFPKILNNIQIPGSMTANDKAHLCIEKNTVSFEWISKCHVIRNPMGDKKYIVNLGQNYCSCGQTQNCYHMQAAHLFQNHTMDSTTRSQEEKNIHFDFAELKRKRKRNKSSGGNTTFWVKRNKNMHSTPIKHLDSPITHLESDTNLDSEIPKNNAPMTKSLTKPNLINQKINCCCTNIINLELFACSSICKDNFVEDNEYLQSLAPEKTIDGVFLSKSMLTLLNMFGKEENFVLLTSTVYQYMFLAESQNGNNLVLEFLEEQNLPSTGKRDIAVLIPRSPGRDDHWMLGIIKLDSVSIYDSIPITDHDTKGTKEETIIEHFEKMNEIADEHFKIKTIRKNFYNHLTLPLQNNSYDCGLFVVAYFYYLLKNEMEEKWCKIDSDKGRRWIYHLTEIYNHSLAKRISENLF